MKKDFKMVGALVGFIMLAYFGVWSGFFQQDEWSGLGGFFALQGLGLAELLKEMYRPMFAQGLGHFLPWTPITNYWRYALFGLNYPPYTILSLVLHAVATILIFLLGQRLTKSNTASGIAALFFAVAASASQAVTWVGTSLPTQLAAIFSLVAIIFWLDWLAKEKRKDLWLALGSLILAVGFKETALFLFVFLPAVGYVAKPKLRRKLFVSFSLVVAAYAFLRVAILVTSLGPGGAVNTLSDLTQPLVKRGGKVILTGTAQVVLPQEFILTGSEVILQELKLTDIPEKGNPAYDLFLENKVVKPVTRVASILILLVLLFLMKQNPALLLFPFLLFLTAFLPLVLIPTGELAATFLAPRGLYLPVAGFALIFGKLTTLLLQKKSLLVVPLFLLVTGHFGVLRAQIVHLNSQGQERLAILEEIKNNYPDLPPKVIFYTESNRSYYGLPATERVMPFQSGFGQTLLVWYYASEQWPAELLRNRFLWEITDQGYKESGERGFGYFRDFGLLVAAVRQYNIPTDTVIAFSWDSQEEKLSDVTGEVRKRLEK